MIWLTLGIIISAIGGLLLSLYITKNKHSDDHMVCPLGQSCAPLVNGKFSRFLGLPIERLGTAFYITMIVVYLATLFRFVPDWVLTLGVLIAGLSFAFSMYLTIIQLFVVKKWCTISLGSTAITFLIIVLAFIGYEGYFAEFAYTSRDLLKWIYAGGVILGTIATSLHARTFVRFLRDFEISRLEEKRLEMFSQTAWIAIGLSFLSGLGLVLTDRWREFTDSNAFIVMLTITIILIVYEVVMNMVIGPRLIDIHFGDHPELDDHAHGFQRKLAFAAIAVGVVSWYSLLLLSVFDWFAYSTGILFVGYIAFIIISVLVITLVENTLYKKSLLLNNDTEENKKQD